MAVILNILQLDVNIRSISAFIPAQLLIFFFFMLPLKVSVTDSKLLKKPFVDWLSVVLIACL